MAEPRTVKEMWWEGKDLHVVFADNGQHTIYVGAEVVQSEAFFGTGITKFVSKEDAPVEQVEVRVRMEGETQ